MKKWLFLISGIIEISGSMVVYLNPSTIFQNLLPNSVEAKLYGITMLCFGVTGLLCFKHYRESDLLKHLFLVHLFLHAVITVMTYNTPSESFHLAKQASLTHGIIFILFVLGYLNDIKKD